MKWISTGLFYVTLAFMVVTGLLLLCVHIFRLNQARTRNPKIFKENLISYLLFLAREIPAILTILGFASLFVLISENALASITSWLLFLYLQVKAGEEMHLSKAFVKNEEDKKLIQYMWIALAAFSTLIFNTIIWLISARLIEIAQAHP